MHLMPNTWHSVPCTYYNPNGIVTVNNFREEDMDESVKLRDSSSKKNEKSTTFECLKYFTRIGVGDD